MVMNLSHRDSQGCSRPGSHSALQFPLSDLRCYPIALSSCPPKNSTTSEFNSRIVSLLDIITTAARAVLVHGGTGPHTNFNNYSLPVLIYDAMDDFIAQDKAGCVRLVHILGTLYLEDLLPEGTRNRNTIHSYVHDCLATAHANYKTCPEEGDNCPWLHHSPCVRAFTIPGCPLLPQRPRAEDRLAREESVRFDATNVKTWWQVPSWRWFHRGAVTVPVADVEMQPANGSFIEGVEGGPGDDEGFMDKRVEPGPSIPTGVARGLLDVVAPMKDTNPQELSPVFEADSVAPNVLAETLVGDPSAHERCAYHTLS